MAKKIIFTIFLLLFTYINFPDFCFAQEVTQKVVMIIPAQDFRDEELLLPKDELETNRVEVVIASSTTTPAKGMLGTVIKPDILLDDIQLEDYDAIIFVGGSGAKEFWDDALAHNIAIQADRQKKIIGAICIAPVTLAHARILKGKRATVWSSLASEIESWGAIYTGKDVEIDGNIITANGPQAAERFAEELVKALIRQR